MPKQKRNREWVSTRARAAAIEAARRRQMRRRVGAAIVVGVLVLALVGGAFAVTRDSGTSTVVGPDDVSTTTSETVPSVEGQPCVDFNDDLPVGAPVVPVKVGPPPTTLVTEDLKVGDGAIITPGQTVSAHYIGVSCTTGKIFDSSWSRGEPSSFSLQEVIEGWQTGIPGMKVGGQRLLGIPPDLAYGAQGRPPAIAPGETLWFVVDIVSAS